MRKAWPTYHLQNKTFATRGDCVGSKAMTSDGIFVLTILVNQFEKWDSEKIKRGEIE